MPLLEALSAIREVVVSKVIDFFLDKLASSDLLQFATEKEVQQEIQKLNKELKEIRAVLDDAEERQMKEHPVKDWLIHLQDLAYDVEDVLDEFATEMGSRNLMMERRGSSSKRPRLIPDSYKAAMFNRDMMSKIKYIFAKLKDLEPQKNKWQLRMMDCERPDRQEERVQPTSVEIETQVYGRDEDKREILDLLLKSDEEGNFVIPIVDDVWNENYHNWIILQSPFLTRTQGSKIVVTTRNLGVSATMGAFHAHCLEVLSNDDCFSVFAQHALGARDLGGHPRLKEVAKKIVRKCSGLPLAAKTIGGLLHTNVDLDAWEDISESEIWKLSEHQSSMIPALQLSYHHLPPHLKRCFAYCSIIPKDYEFEEEEMILLWRAQGFLEEAPDKQCIDDSGRKYFRDLVSRSLFQLSIKDNHRFLMHDLINDLAQSVAGETCFKMQGNQQISKQARHLSYIADMYDGIKKFKGICEAKHLRTFLPLRLSKDGAGYVTNHVLTCLLPKLRWLRVLSLRGYQIEELTDFVGELKHLRYLDFSRTLIRTLPESVSTLYNLQTLLLRKCNYLEKLPKEMEKLVNLCHLDITGANRIQDMASNFSMLTNLQTLSFYVLGKEKGYQIRELQDLSCLKGQLHISGLQNIVEPRDAWMAKLHDKPRIDKLELSWREDFENRIPALEKKVLDGLQPSKKLKELAISFYCGATLADWVGDSFFDDLQSLCLGDCPNLMSLPSIGKLPLLKKVRLKGLGSVTRVGVELFGDIAPCAFPSLEILQFEDMPKWEKWSLPEVEEEAKTFPRLRELLIQKCPLLSGSIPEHLPSLEKLTIQDCEKLRVPIESFPVLSEITIQRCHEVVYKGFTEDSSFKRVSFTGISKFSCAPECLRLRNITVESLEIDNCEGLCSFRENSWGWLTQPMSLRILKIRTYGKLVSTGAEDVREESMQVKIPNNIEHMTIINCQRLEKLSLTLHCLRSVWMIELYSCPKLVYLARNNLPLNLKVLKVYNCGNLQSLLLDEEDVNSKNACLLQQLYIYGCDSLKQINRGELPSTLKELGICRCSKLESIGQGIQDNSSLQSINIFWCDMIKDLPRRLNKLKHLQCIYIEHCTNLVSFPESGLPATSLKVFRLASCEQLQALPANMHCLSSLEELEILDCPNVTSFPEEGIPTNLRSLRIRGPNICKPIMEWGLHRLTSLRALWISNGCPEAVSFPQDEMETTLPSCLTHLEVWNFPKLETLSSNGFRNLTSLEILVIIDCPNLKFLPEKDMLSSLLRLYISSGVLEERCKGDNIAHIPFVSISY
ncbi:hypothetical protein V6N13_091628 [Hibiscus sabdariffa]